MHNYYRAAIAALGLATTLTAAPGARQILPRTPDGKPNLEGIWQASSTAGADLDDHAARLNMLAGRSVVAGGSIPYQPWAVAKKAENFQNRQKADPLNQCYIPGTPRIMYLDYPFQIFQTPEAIAMAFEWSLDYRLIYTDGSRHPADLDSWMGDSRGHWEGDTLVVDVSNMNDKTWLDMAGDFHSGALHVIERYRMTDAGTIQYQATIDDSKVFARPWTFSLVLRRRTDRDRLFEYVCEAETEEANGAFTREPRTWYPGDGSTVPPLAAPPADRRAPANLSKAANIRRKPDGKPDFQGFYEPDAGGANYGLEKRAPTPDNLTPPGRGVIVDPADGKLPMRPWAVQELASRQRTERGYDDPTAHCFPAGVPRSMYVPTAFHLVQTADYLVFLHERMSWRIVRLNGGAHLPDTIRLWQGDSIGRWEGDTLVVDTTNLNGKTWLNEAGEIVSYAEHVVERFTPVGPDTVHYEATVTDPVVYTRPWTVSLSFNREKFELTEAACHEEDRDLPRLKALKDAAAAKK
ncbi:MAG TPA: hypothetical protein VKT49_02760 [Bryobacteraceae bacterium]|nr:hypothetical protein [Bryobacteraceae bacterium]